MRPACRYGTRSVALVRFRLQPHLSRHRERRERNNLRQEEQQAARGFLMIEDAKRKPRNGGMAPSLGKISSATLHLCSVPEVTTRDTESLPLVDEHSTERFKDDPPSTELKPLQRLRQWNHKTCLEASVTQQVY
jgi:hypothetical protein